METNPGIPSRRRGRTILKIAGLVLAVLVIAAGLMLGTSPGLTFTTRLASHFASGPGQQIRIGSLSGVLTGHLRLDEVAIADAQGVWLTVSGLAVDWDPLALATGTLDVSRAEVARVAVARAPLPAPDAAPAPAESGGGVPAIRLKLDALDVREIALAAPVLGEPITLSVAGSARLDDDPMIARAALDVVRKDGTPGTLSLRAIFAPDDNRLDLDVKAAEPSGGVLARTLGLPGLPSVNVALGGTGTLADWNGDLDVRLDGTSVLKGTAKIAAQGRGHRLEAHIGGRMGLFAPRAVAPLLAGDAAIDVDAAYAGGLIDIASAAMKSATSQLAVSGTYGGAAETADITVAGQIGAPDTQLRMDVAEGQSLTIGETHLHARLAGPLDAARWDVKATAVHLETAQASLRNVALVAGGSHADLNAVSSPFDVKLTTDVDAADSALAPFVYGRTALTASGRWSGNTLDLKQAKLSTGSGDVSLAGTLAGDMSSLSMKVLGALRAAHDPTVTAFLAGKPLTLQADIAGTGGTYTVTDAAIRGANADVTAEAAYSGDALSAKGEIARLVLAPLDPRLKGVLTASFAASGPPGAPHVALSVRGQDVALLGKPFADPKLDVDATLASELKATVALTGSLGGKPVVIHAALPAPAPATGGGGDNIRLTVGKAAVTGRLAMQGGPLPHGELRIAIPDLGELGPLLLQPDLGGALDGTVRIGPEDGHETVRLEARSPSLKQGATRIGDLALTATVADPTTALATNGTLTVGRIEAGGVKVSKLTARAEGSNGDTSFSLDAGVDGKPAHLSGRYVARGESAELLLEKASAEYMGVATHMKAPARITLAGGKTTIDGLTLVLPDGALTLAGSAGDTLNLTARGTVPFALGRTPLAAAGIRLDGKAKVDVAVRGTAAKPAVTGTVTTADATFVETGSGITLRDIGGTIRLGGNKATFESLTGRMGAKGKLTVNGAIGIDPASKFMSDLKIALAGVNYTDGKIVNATVDADLTMKGPLTGTPVLGGHVDIQRADIQIPGNLPGSAASLNVTHLNASPEVRAQAAVIAPPPPPEDNAPQTGIDMQVEVNAPRRIYVRGRGMDAELGGKIRLSGPAATPSAVGAFDMIKGKMDILTRHLDFDHGHVTMIGSLDPVLDFAANNAAGGITTTITISGRASNPQVAFTSVPSLPNDEVMARFFFDKSIAELSPVQLAQLASAVATLTGLTSGPGVMDKIRNLLGVDNLEFSNDPNGGGPSVSAGGYISDKAYVGVKQGTDLSSSSVTTNIDLTDTIKLKGDIDSTGKTKAGVFMEKDY